MKEHLAASVEERGAWISEMSRLQTASLPIVQSDTAAIHPQTLEMTKDQTLLLVKMIWTKIVKRQNTRSLYQLDQEHCFNLEIRRPRLAENIYMYVCMYVCVCVYKIMFSGF